MRLQRYFQHPVVGNRKWWTIFSAYFAISLALGGYLYATFQNLLVSAKIEVYDLGFQQTDFVTFLVSPYSRLFLIPIVAVVAAAVTTAQVKGPIMRIEEFLIQLESNLPVPPLRIRQKDKFGHLVSLLNQLQARLKRAKPSN